MPLKKGASNIGANIKELEQHGSRTRSHAQILAIALHAAGVPKKGAGVKRRGTLTALGRAK